MVTSYLAHHDRFFDHQLDLYSGGSAHGFEAAL